MRIVAGWALGFIIGLIGIAIGFLLIAGLIGSGWLTPPGMKSTFQPCMPQKETMVGELER